MEISIEADAKKTELTVLRVDPKSDAAKDFNGKEVMVCAPGADQGRILWVRPETGVTNGIVAGSTYEDLQNQQESAEKIDKFELRQLTRRQRLVRYGRLEMSLAALAVVVAAAAALKLVGDRIATDVANGVAIAGPLLIAVLGFVDASGRVRRPPWK